MHHVSQTLRSATPLDHQAGNASPGLRGRLPPQSFFLVSAVFHYLGPSLAVLLFARIDVLGVAWLPLATVGAIEFLGTVLLAALGARTRRNSAALVLTTLGVVTITEIRVTAEPLGFAFAFGNCALFMLYVILGHRIANAPASNAAGQPARIRVWAGSNRPKPGFEPVSAGPPSGIDLLAAAMLVAAVAATPIGLGGALPAFSHPVLLLAGAGVGVCSSVIPYVTDQLAMARLPRATFALMLALLPAFATLIGAVVLGQVPTAADLAGIALVVAGVALHH